MDPPSRCSILLSMQVCSLSCRMFVQPWIVAALCTVVTSGCHVLQSKQGDCITQLVATNLSVRQAASGQLQLGRSRQGAVCVLFLPLCTALPGDNHALRMNNKAMMLLLCMRVEGHCYWLCCYPPLSCCCLHPLQGRLPCYPLLQCKTTGVEYATALCCLMPLQ